MPAIGGPEEWWMSVFRGYGKKWAGACLFGLALCLVTPPAQAQTESTTKVTTASSNSPWSLCERATVAAEMAQRLPRAMLFSVSMVESGRFNKQTRQTRPWPWTINAEGQSYYFKTKSEAIAATKALLKEGMRSIDIGCMQVNLRYHPNAFADLEAAFDPATNVAYSADFLKRLYGRTDSWPEAIAAYHSQSKTRSQPYFARVIDVWTDQHARISKLALVLKEQAKAQVAAQLRQAQEEPVSTLASNDARPAILAPKVLATEDVDDIRETAVAGVGLRLSIADGDFAETRSASYHRQPEVMNAETNTAPAHIETKPTILADASPGV